MEFLSLIGRVTRDGAVEQLLTDSVSEEEDSELCINAGAVEAVDVVTATAARMRIARHLREHPRGRVTMYLPRRADVAVRLAGLLAPAPDGVTVLDAPDGPAPAHHALVPATVIGDAAVIPLVGEFTLIASAQARISRRRGRFIAATVMELAANALEHGAGATDHPVVAVTSLGRERHVEVAVTDAGTALSGVADPAAVVGAIPGRAVAARPGFLGNIMQLGRTAGVEVEVEMIAGTARLRWSTSRHRTERRRHVPGTTVVARISA